MQNCKTVIFSKIQKCTFAECQIAENAKFKITNLQKYKSANLQNVKLQKNAKCAKLQKTKL